MIFCDNCLRSHAMNLGNDDQTNISWIFGRLRGRNRCPIHLAGYNLRLRAVAKYAPRATARRSPKVERPEFRQPRRQDKTKEWNLAVYDRCQDENNGVSLAHCHVLGRPVQAAAFWLVFASHTGSCITIPSYRSAMHANNERASAHVLLAYRRRSYAGRVPPSIASTRSSHVAAVDLKRYGL
nr:hypothetical protein CFP56_04632 [Quercus suber]